jgi:hypothetical protein
MVNIAAINRRFYCNGFKDAIERRDSPTPWNIAGSNGLDGGMNVWWV